MIAYLRETVNKRPVPASQICSGGGSVKLFDVLTFTRNRHSIVSIGTQRVGKQIRFVCHTKKIPKPLKGLGIKECRWWGSNPYGVTTNGFWVGPSEKNLVDFLGISRNLFPALFSEKAPIHDTIFDFRTYLRLEIWQTNVVEKSLSLCGQSFKNGRLKTTAFGK